MSEKPNPVIPLNHGAPTGPYRICEGGEGGGWIRIDRGPANEMGDPDYDAGGETLISDDTIGYYVDSCQIETRAAFYLWAAAPDLVAAADYAQACITIALASGAVEGSYAVWLGQAKNQLLSAIRRTEPKGAMLWAPDAEPAQGGAA
ncbi:hypothetical protein [Nitrospirillum amazonense]|uniref:hypothetical protein n=1 Tax=Nitrospirillum amazonense TaxID=28077 RepID=UPI002412DB86|nr:hypothetical protein [Nitrospirillum amazonense]MDG3444510.1 hypothetical protein [Nitrospirillum amazonense]